MGKQEQNRQGTAGTCQGSENSGAGSSLPDYTSENLFAGANQIIIRHDGNTCQLRITRNRRLILTK